MSRYAFGPASPSADAVRRLIARSLPSPRFSGASLVVHPDDDMFAFSVGITGHDAIGAMAYFRAGISIHETVRKIVDWRYGGFSGIRSFLDFASGYGRSTRFLVEELSPSSVCVAEIQAEALSFQRREFGVNILQSTTDPAQLHDDRSFDVVFVASLFTHLPERTFGPWLARVWDFVAPNGTLILSVHDEAINDVGAELTDGFAFIPSTEVASLSTDDYGTNFTSEEFVRRKIEGALGSDVAIRAIRLPRALCFMQDVWVLGKDSNPVEELRYECGPSGAVDSAQIEGASAVIVGWAGDLGFATGNRSSHEISSVVVYVNGEQRAHGCVGNSRPDVAKHLGRPTDDVLLQSGFQVTFKSRGLRPRDVLTVVATCEYGASFVCDSTTIEDLSRRAGETMVSRTLTQRLRTAGRLVRAGGWRAVVGHALTLLGREIESARVRIEQKGR